MNAKFLKSAAKPKDFPPDTGREVAVAGRSNSGKSSAINAILGRRGLARVSKTPGRTQLINFFDLGDSCRLVDLPGYGFAKVSVDMRERWRELIEVYFGNRRSLAGLIVTVDIRRGVLELDEAMIEWAAALGVPVLVLATKADKLSRAAAGAQQRAMERRLPESARVLAFSAPKRLGVSEALAQIEGWLACSK